MAVWRTIFRPFATTLAALGLAVWGGGCGPATPTPSATPPKGPHTLRIASFSPAISRTLVDLGIGGSVVGRTPFCDALDREVPVVGSLLEIDFERLHAAAPNHLMVQPAAQGVDPALRAVAERQGWALHAWRLDRLADVERMVAELPTALWPAGPERMALQGQADRLQEAIRGLHAQSPAADAPRVLMLVGVEPLTAAGSATFLSELLEGLGRRNAMSQPGYPELTLEDLVVLAPDAIVILREAEPSAGERVRLLRAIDRPGDANHVVVLSHRDAMLPSSAAPSVAAALDQALVGIGVGRSIADSGEGKDDGG